MVMMIRWSELCDGWKLEVMAVMVFEVVCVSAGRWM